MARELIRTMYAQQRLPGLFDTAALRTNLHGHGRAAAPLRDRSSRPAARLSRRTVADPQECRRPRRLCAAPSRLHDRAEHRNDGGVYQGLF